jgi:nucleoside 2-deoxyribosyltransferase
MKIQLAYKMTGENREEVVEMLEKVKDILESRDFEVYIPELNSERPESKKELYLDTFGKIDSSDVLLAVVRSDKKSEGMLMEIGYAMGKGKKIVAAVCDCVGDTHLRELAHFVVEFDGVDDLYDKLNGVEF